LNVIGNVIYAGEKFCIVQHQGNFGLNDLVQRIFTIQKKIDIFRGKVSLTTGSSVMCNLGLTCYLIYNSGLQHLPYCCIQILNLVWSIDSAAFSHWKYDSLYQLSGYYYLHKVIHLKNTLKNSTLIFAFCLKRPS